MVIKRLVVGGILLAGTCSAYAASVVVANKEWRQVTDTSGLSWNQVASVCSSSTGVCSGSIGAISFDGWIWAANSEIRALFEQLILPSTTQFTSDTFAYNAPNSADIDAAIGAPNFNSVNSTANQDLVQGFSRTIEHSGFAFTPYLVDDKTIANNDQANLGHTGLINISGTVLGSWLYKPAVVPLPAAAWLLLSGAGGMLAMTRRRRAAA